MNCYLYLFESHSIQQFILESGRLADMVGASELIEDLFRDPLDNTLEALKITVSEKNFIRRGGGAWTIMMDSEDDAIRLRNTWGLIMAEKAPGLPFCHAVCAGKSIAEALARGRNKLKELRSDIPPRLPVPGPLIKRSPRTGNPAVEMAYIKRNWEWVDEATRKKREDKFRQGTALNGKFLSKEDLEKYGFPLNLDPKEDDAFPFESDNHYIAIIHADGNGIGEVFIRLGEKLKTDPSVDISHVYRQLSAIIKKATEQAARFALQPIIEKAESGSFPKDKSKIKRILPFRPLILGGDDLTVIIRADFALDFAKRFIESFEAETTERLEAMAGKHLPDMLTACAGICFVKANYPFYLGYELAESLCSYAKKTARQHLSGENDMIPSAVTFHRVTTSFMTDYESVQQAEMTRNQGDDRYILTMGAYGVGQFSQNMPKLSDMVSLKKLFQGPDMSGGPLRHFLTLFHAELADAQKAYDRWNENMSRQEILKECLKMFNLYTDNLVGPPPSNSKNNLPFKKIDPNTYRTYLGDLMHLIAVEGEAYDS